VVTLLTLLTNAGHLRVQSACARILTWTRPAASGQVLGTLADLARSKPELVAENVFLRQQLIVLRRSVEQPTLTRTDRMLLVLLDSRVRAWRQALLISKPDTLLRWHRQGFHLFWRHKSTGRTRTPWVPAETIALIAEMATRNRLWGLSGSRRTPQAWYSPVEEDDPEVPAARSAVAPSRADVIDLPAQSRSRHLDV
jgi:hypothetical protein